MSTTRDGRRALGADCRVIVVDHYDSYTWNLVHLIAQEARRPPVVVQHDEVSASEVLNSDFTHLVLSPGPGSPDVPLDFAVGRELILRSDIPVLGVCLGMQGIVTALGGQVSPIDPAHGLISRISHSNHHMFTAVPDAFDAVRYHSLAATRLPRQLRMTAWSGPPSKRTIMAIAHVGRPIWGVQYHPESVLTQYGDTLISNFLRLP